MGGWGFGARAVWQTVTTLQLKDSVGWVRGGFGARKRARMIVCARAPIAKQVKIVNVTGSANSLLCLLLVLPFTFTIFIIFAIGY